MTFKSKWIAIIILLLSTSILAEAQQSDKFKTQFKFGVSGGAVFSEVDFEIGRASCRERV